MDAGRNARKRAPKNSEDFFLIFFLVITIQVMTKKKKVFTVFATNFLLARVA